MIYWHLFPGSTVVKNLPANAGDIGSFPGWGRSPKEENGNSLQYSCLENPMDKGAWWATVHRVTKSQTQLSMHIHIISLKVKAPLLLPHFPMWRDFNQSRDSHIFCGKSGGGGGSFRKSGKAYGPLLRIMFLNVYNMIFRGIEEINYS